MIFCDTSVLVAAAVAQSVHHEPSLAVYLKATKQRACCAAHNLAEVYATLTNMPGNQRMHADQALLVLDGIIERFKVIALEPDEYCEAIANAAAHGILGGTIYDALIAHCALKAKATILYTWNVRYFRRCGPEIASKVRTPPEHH